MRSKAEKSPLGFAPRSAAVVIGRIDMGLDGSIKGARKRGAASGVAPLWPGAASVFPWISWAFRARITLETKRAVLAAVHVLLGASFKRGSIVRPAAQKHPRGPDRLPRGAVDRNLARSSAGWLVKAPVWQKAAVGP